MNLRYNSKLIVNNFSILKFYLYWATMNIFQYFFGYFVCDHNNNNLKILYKTFRFLIIYFFLNNCVVSTICTLLQVWQFLLHTTNKTCYLIRFTKHTRNHRYARLGSSSVAQHMNDIGHNINIENLGTLKSGKFIERIARMLVKFSHYSVLIKIEEFFFLHFKVDVGKVLVNISFFLE